MSVLDARMEDDRFEPISVEMCVLSPHIDVIGQIGWRDKCSCVSVSTCVGMSRVMINGVYIIPSCQIVPSSS